MLSIPNLAGAIAVAGATAAAGADHSILIAILTAVIGLVGVVLAPILSDWIRARRSAKRLGKQQNELQSHYAEELRELRRENTELRRENDRLREHP